MKIPGIPGESRDERFLGWIDVLSLGFDGHLNEGFTGALVVSKGIDQSSLPLKLALMKGRVLPDVTIMMTESIDGQDRVFAKLELRDVRVTSSSEEGPSKKNGVLEQLDLSFRQVIYSYQSLSGEKTTSFVDGGEEVDSDQDGMSDSFEEFYGFDKLVADGHLDSDKDGFTDLEEFRLGLNPRSAASTFRLNALKQKGTGGVKLSWQTKPGKVYRIYTAPSLDKPFQLFREVTASELKGEIDLGKLGLRGFFRVEQVGE